MFDLFVFKIILNKHKQYFVRWSWITTFLKKQIFMFAINISSLTADETFLSITNHLFHLIFVCEIFLI